MIIHRGYVIVFPHQKENDFFTNYAHEKEFRAALQQRCNPGECVYFPCQGPRGPRGYPDPRFSGVFSSEDEARSAISERIKNSQDPPNLSSPIFQGLLNS